MKKYLVTVRAESYQTMEVEAENQFDAMEIACNDFEAIGCDWEVNVDECIFIEDIPNNEDDDFQCEGQISMWD